MYKKFAIPTLLLALACTGLQAQSSKNSAYDGLDQARLVDMLSQMHMSQLIDELQRQSQSQGSGASVESVWALANGKIALANNSDDPDKRCKMLDEAATMLEDIIKRTAAETDMKVVVSNLEYRFTLVDVWGRMQCSMRADQMIKLMGGDEDRKFILNYTGKVLSPRKNDKGETILCMLDELAALVDRSMEKCNENNVLSVLHRPKIEQTQEKLRFAASWIRFYRGLAATAKEERQKYLNEAMQGADRFAKGEYEEEGKNPAALLLQGLCSIELGITERTAASGPASAAADATASAAAKASGDNEFAEAEKYFQAALQCPPEKLEPPLQIDINYHTARNLIEWGKYDQAVKSVDAYTPLVVKLLGPSAVIQGDLNTSLLKNYLYMKWAAATTDKAQAGQHRLSGQKALTDFISAHNDEGLRQAFFKIIANKYRGQDAAKLSPIFQFAIGVDEFNIGTDMNDNKEHLQKAADTLKQLLDSTAPEAKELQDEANRIYGLAMVKLGGGRAGPQALVKAGKMVDLLNACISYKNLIDNRSDSDMAGLRKEYIEALKKLLGNAEWVKATGPDGNPVNIWFIDLGQQYHELAQLAEGKDKIALMQLAIEAYRQVPQSNAKMYMEAQHTALVMEFMQLSMMKEQNATPAELNKLATDSTKQMRDYSQAALAALKNVDPVKDKLYSDSLTNWGADSMLLCATLLYEALDQKAEALRILDEIPQKWPKATQILLEATVYEIRKHIEAQETKDAIEHINNLRKSHPEQANSLMRLVIDQLRNEIAKKRNDPSAKAQEELKKARTVYLDFSNELLKNVADKSAEEKYPYEQMHADALLENGSTEEALKVFERLNGLEETKRKAKEKEIDDYVGTLITKLADNKSNAPAIKKAADEFEGLVKEKGMDPTRKGYVQSLKIAIQYANQDTTSESDAQFRVKQVFDKLRDAYNGLKKDLKATIPTDSVNIQGLARAYRAIKKYSESVEFYSKLTGGLDPFTYRDQYGQAQLERCQCLFEYFQSNPDAAKKKEQMANMLLQLKRFRELDAQLWGRYAEFNKLEADVKKASE